MMSHKYFLVLVSIMSAGLLESTPLIDAAQAGEIEKVRELLAQPGIKVDEEEKGNTALIAAIPAGHLEVVKLLIDNGADVNKKTSEGTLALDRAAFLGQFDIVDLLIERGAKIDAQTGPFLRTALMSAINFSRNDVVRLLIKRGADVTIKDSLGRTALLLAKRKGYPEIVELIEEALATPLMRAVTTGDEKSVEALLKGSTVNVNEQDDSGNTALMMAAKKGRPKIVTLLISHGADIRMQNGKGETALSLAEAQEHAYIVRLLREALEPVPALIQAVIDEKTEQVKDLLKQEIDVNAQDDQGRTALIWAIALDRFEIFEELLRHQKLNVNQPDQAGKTPLMYAAETSNAKYLSKLLAKKATLDVQDNDGLTALMYAVKKAYTDQVEMLLKAGANKQLKDKGTVRENEEQWTAHDYAEYIHTQIPSRQNILDLLAGKPITRTSPGKKRSPSPEKPSSSPGSSGSGQGTR